MSQVTGDAAQPQDYWGETRQPVYSAALVLPFLLVYELGLVFLRSDVINGGDAILLTLGGSMMRLLGLHASFASVLVLAVVFVVAQVRRKGSWALRPPLLATLLFESLLYAVLLFLVLGYFVQYLPRDRRAARAPHGAPCACAPPSRAAGPAPRPEQLPGPTALERDVRQDGWHGPVPMGRAASRPGLRDFILYCGAGVYEELVFRVILLGLLMLVFTKLLHLEHAHAAVWAVIAGALIFSAFHHIGNDDFRIGVFLQRVFAGLYFAAVYFNRSFGVAAASHALYDILVGLNQYV